MTNPESASERESDGRGRQSKVTRVLKEYNLKNLGSELETYWTAEPNQRKSLRELEEFFNKRIIEAKLENAGEGTLPGEVDTIYSALRGEDATKGLQQEVKARLELAKVDIESLENDMVSYQSIRTYLQKERGVEYDPQKKNPVGSAKDQIQGLKGRVNAVTEDRLDMLKERGEISLGNHTTLVQVQVYCEDCGRQYSIEDLLDGGGCSCTTNP